MLQGIWETLRRLTWPLLAAGFVVGVLVGLLLGWQVWPVRWYDTDPSDLREQHKMTYVVMASDSLAITGNQEVARRRIGELTDKRNSWEKVADLVERTAQEREKVGDAAGALRVRRLAQSVQLPAPQPAASAPAPKVTARVPRWVIFLLALGAFLVALAILLWFVAQRSRAELVAEGVLEEGTGSTGEPPAGLRWPFAAKQPALASEPPVASAEPEEELDYEEEEEEAEEEPGPEQPAFPRAGAPRVEQTRRVLASRPETKELHPRVPWEEQPARNPVAETSSGPARAPAATGTPSGPLGTFEVEYNTGDDDLDRSFSIESPGGDFLGECGVGISDVVRVDGAQQVDAFEVWLFDKGDIRTVSKILVSENAYQDEGLQARLSGKGELVQAQPGLAVTLQTLSLRVTATISECEYAPDEEAPNTIFSHLKVELLAELSDSAR